MQFFRLNFNYFQGIKTIPTEFASDNDQNEAPHVLFELKKPPNTGNKEMSTEKRSKFQVC